MLLAVTADEPAAQAESAGLFFDERRGAAPRAELLRVPRLPAADGQRGFDPAQRVFGALQRRVLVAEWRARRRNEPIPTLPLLAPRLARLTKLVARNDFRCWWLADMCAAAYDAGDFDALAAALRILPKHASHKDAPRIDRLLAFATLEPLRSHAPVHECLEKMKFD